MIPSPHLQAVPDASKYKPYRRPITVILADLSKPIPAKYLATRKQGRATLTYVPWYNVCKLLDRCAPGWQGEVTHIHTTRDRIFVTYRLSLWAEEGVFTREATGTELLKEAKPLKDEAGHILRTGAGIPQTKMEELAYGDPSSNAESMAFRRAAAKFGLGLYLYDKD